MSPCTVGDPVPETIAFKIFHNGETADTTIGSYRGKWLILFFYPGDFTFVCPTELAEIASKYDEFQKHDTEIVSISTDTVFSHKMWHQTSPMIQKVRFPMGSDHRHTLVDFFGVYCEEDGLAYRATIIIDPKGIVRCTEVHDNSIGRSADELLRKVKAAKYVAEHPGQVCPAGWSEGDKTLEPDDDLVGKL
ncbi:MAG: redoxin domain-containing protein [Candidatus Kaiserbacteria bacterium]|nr:redoxin domain-containing protein [Candidatus Kaiserbacteria bacterium]